MPNTDIRRHVMDILAYRSLTPNDKIRRLTMMREEEAARGGEASLAVIQEALHRLDNGAMAATAH